MTIYLPTDAKERANFPMFDGLLGYFPAALAWVSYCSKVGNDQHNPGQDLHWSMDKSSDHKNKIIKHLLDVGTDDVDEIPHSVKVAWRSLALAQIDLMERKNAPMPHNGRKNETINVKESSAKNKYDINYYLALMWDQARQINEYNEKSGSYFGFPK